MWLSILTIIQTKIIVIRSCKRFPCCSHTRKISIIRFTQFKRRIGPIFLGWVLILHPEVQHNPAKKGWNPPRGVIFLYRHLHLSLHDMIMWRLIWWADPGANWTCFPAQSRFNLISAAEGCSRWRLVSKLPLRPWHICHWWSPADANRDRVESPQQTCSQLGTSVQAEGFSLQMSSVSLVDQEDKLAHCALATACFWVSQHRKGQRSISALCSSGI